VSRARQYLGYQPKVGLHQGLAAEWRWVCQLYPRAKSQQG
jgi:hypothetical protein